MIKLKKLMENEQPKKVEQNGLSEDAKRHFLEIISTYGSFGPKIKTENDLSKIAETLGAVTDAVHEVIEKGQMENFDDATKKRNMSELEKLSSQFDKIANECNSLQTQMENLYEDMGHIVSKYFGMSELTEEEANKRLGIR